MEQSQVPPATAGGTWLACRRASGQAWVASRTKTGISRSVFNW